MGADVEGFDSCGCALARHVPETIVSTAATTSADFLPMNVSSEKAIELRCDPRWAVHHVAPWNARRQSAHCRRVQREPVGEKHFPNQESITYGAGHCHPLSTGGGRSPFDSEKAGE